MHDRNACVTQNGSQESQTSFSLVVFVICQTEISVWNEPVPCLGSIPDMFLLGLFCPAPVLAKKYSQGWWEVDY